ncbi:MAG: DUF2207 domain-containing protein [Aerococcus sp.]|nr:DUF2207 domain-containing protein [Aerococcus sp.]
MIKKRYQLLLSVLFAILVGSGLFIQTSRAEETIRDYQATYVVNDDGSMTLKEQFTYPVHDLIDHIDHRIGVNDSSQLEQLNVNMRASNQSQAFPFVEGDAKDVGTYHLVKQGNDINLTLYNQMSKDNEIITTEAKIKNAWVKYDTKNILEFPLLRLPHALQQAHVKIQLPADVNPTDVQLMTTGISEIDSWWQDKRTLVFEIPKAAATESVNLTMSVSSTLLANNKNEGPQSKGQQIIQRMNEEQAAEAQRDQWKRVFMWAIVVVVGVVIVGYSFLLLRKKQSYKDNQPAYTDGRLDYPLHSPILLARLLKIRLTREQGLWLTIFQLVAKGQLLVRWQLDKDEQLVDAWLTVRERQADDPIAQLVLDAFVSQKDGVEVSYQAFKYQNKTAKRASRLYRQLLRQMRQSADQMMTKRQLIEKRPTLIFGIGWWFCVIVLSVGTLGLFLLMTMVHQSYWLFLIMALYLIWLLVLKHLSLPIYSGVGLSTSQYWRQYLNQLPSGTKQDAPVWNWNMDYLYSWLMNKNQHQYQNIKQHGQAEQNAFVRQMKPVRLVQLKNFK